MIHKHVIWSSPSASIWGDWELVNAIDDAFIVAVLVGTVDHLVPPYSG